MFFFLQHQDTDSLVLRLKFPVQVDLHYQIEERDQPTYREFFQIFYIEQALFEYFEEIKLKFLNTIQENLRSAVKHAKWVEVPTKYQEILLAEKENMSQYIC